MSLAKIRRPGYEPALPTRGSLSVVTTESEAIEAAMRFEILGPIRVRTTAGELTIKAGRERTLLAMLLLHAGEMVPAGRLVEAIWDSEPPGNARNQLHGCVSRLRKLLGAADDQGGRVIVTEPAGYRALIEPLEFDLWEFRRLRDEARDLSISSASESNRRYRAALGLWRGSALADVESALVRPASAALDEERLQVLEERLQVELDLGRTTELIGELSELTARYPYREGLYRALMLALYRADRQADALATYRRAHQLLRDELGTEPTLRLQELHQAILGHEPSLVAPSAKPQPVSASPLPAVPHELPPTIAGFTGRSHSLRMLDRLLAESSPTQPAPVLIPVITGMAGVGKSALAVQWAHGVAESFPDGQVYLDLRGYSTAGPLSPAEALPALLRSLGTPPEQIPADPAEAAARYRSQVANRRILLVLDEARSVEQVRPLLPGGPGCLVLVTSRNRLTGLVARDGARPISLDVFSDAEAHSLLAQLVGKERVAAEPAATNALADACAYLPLALRIAAANLVSRPHRTIEAYVNDLTTSDRLAALDVEGDHESAVWNAFARSYDTVSADARRMFRLLGLVPGPDFTPAAGAAVADLTLGAAALAVGHLADAHLIREHEPGRYAFHDLLRLYATKLCDLEEAEDERRAATQRLLDGYLRTADAAANLLYPQMLRLPLASSESPMLLDLRRSTEALEWLDAEGTNLVAAVVYAAEHRLRPYAWQLADRLRGYFWHGRHIAAWRTAANAALAAAERDGDARAKAATHFGLAHLHQSTAQPSDAIVHYSSAAEWAEQAGWVECLAANLTNQGRIYQLRGEPERAADQHSRALELNRDRANLGWQAVNLVNLGVITLELGRISEALRHLSRAQDVNRKLGYRHGEAAACNGLAAAYRELGAHDRAQEAAIRSLDLYQQTGDRAGETAALCGLATIYDAAGRLNEAIEAATRGVALGAEIGDSGSQADALHALARTYLHRGDAAGAIHGHRRALEAARRAGVRRSETMILVDLSVAHTHEGDQLAAGELAKQGLDRAREAGYRLIEGRALTVLAEIRLHTQDHPAALGYADQAVDCHRSTGCRLGEAEALTVLGRIQYATGDPTAAEQTWRTARLVYQAARGDGAVELVR